MFEAFTMERCCAVFNCMQCFFKLLGSNIRLIAAYTLRLVVSSELLQGMKELRFPERCLFLEVR
jgi:hypothetical protein